VLPLFLVLSPFLGMWNQSTGFENKKKDCTENGLFSHFDTAPFLGLNRPQ